MDKRKMRRWVWAAIPLALLLTIGVFWVFQGRTPDMNALYAASVADAVTAEQEEIEPLLELTTASPLTTWDVEGRVLLLSWHSYPERYPAGGALTLSEGAVWVFTDREIAAFYAENKDSVTDWDLRLKQLIGLPPDSAYTHVSGFWADPADVVRPAYVTDITGQMQLAFPADTDPGFRAWFEENSTYSYEESAYPWTRLGYTYDWADNGTEYGLTEFLIEQDAPVQIAFTKTTEDFLMWLAEGAQMGGV